MLRWLPVACLMILLVPGCTLVDAPLPKENQTNIAAVPAETSAFHAAGNTTATLQRTTTVSQLFPPDSAGEIARLFGFQLSQLQDIISPHSMPCPRARRHHGIDFGFYTYGAFTTMENHRPIHRTVPLRQ